MCIYMHARVTGVRVVGGRERNDSTGHHFMINFLLQAFSMSRIYGAFCDAGQNYKNLVGFIKGLGKHFPSLMVCVLCISSFSALQMSILTRNLCLVQARLLNSLTHCIIMWISHS